MFRLVCLLSFLAITTGCAINPATGGADVVLMSEHEEISIGREMHEKMVSEGQVYDNQALQDYVDRIGQSLVSNSHREDLPFTFTVIDSPDINAFATPGGFVYINRGLLAYLDGEAELAGVLAHEIGHITARHAVRQKTAGVTNSVLATMAYIITGSSDVAEASNMAGTALVRGYGREHELEADGLGAKYMHDTGYDTDALLEVIGVLKDQEQFQRVKAKSSGKKISSYHGLYSSHPRNDARLQRVIRTAGELDQINNDPTQPGEFRQHMEGLGWGESTQSEREENRYYHNKLGFTFAHPDNWTVVASAKSIVAAAADNSAKLTITIRKRDQKGSPRGSLEKNAMGSLSKGKELDQAGLKGYTAVASANASSRRLAAIDYANITYLFEGEATRFSVADPGLLKIIESFRATHPKERKKGKPRYIHYIQVPRGATMATLASSIRIPDAQAQLRLLNGFYPRGEPRTGDWIKVVR
ncbi:MAG: M48 family metalloprotease [Halieaceae bacterium]|nr:M48 family metalloprotease [Halieaceae bacterium]